MTALTPEQLARVLTEHARWLRHEGGQRARFFNADFRGADLRDVNLRGAGLSGADLSGAVLAGADLSEADLSDAKLRGADLTGADLRGADFFDADIREADLTAADLLGAVFSGADLRGARMPETIAQRARRVLGTRHHAAGSRLGDLTEALRRLEALEGATDTVPSSRELVAPAEALGSWPGGEQ